MPNKMFKTLEREPKLKCPKCGKRMKTDMSIRELQIYGNITPPQAGDLTQCDECRTILEYVSDPKIVRVQIAPQWRVDLLNEAEESFSEPSLSEMVKSIQHQKPLRMRGYFHSQVKRTT